ncbi:MAG: hypothetical protein FWF43_05730 [Propionibacteriaceae bacterium]|nr:hypothetical protein [Propionibacteriaceae bacterium]
MARHENDSIRRIAKWSGLVGLAASLLGFVVLVGLSYVPGKWLAGLGFGAKVISVLSAFVYTGIPMAGGVLVAFWVVVVVWNRLGAAAPVLMATNNVDSQKDSCDDDSSDLDLDEDADDRAFDLVDLDEDFDDYFDEEEFVKEVSHVEVAR